MRREFLPVPARDILPPGLIAWISFVAVFVALGLGVVFIAFRGGPRGRSAGRGGDRGRGGPSRGNRQTPALGVTATIVLLGLMVPALILAGNSREEKGPGGVALPNGGDVDGRQVFSRYCASFRTLKGANAVGTVETDLDEVRPPKALILDAIPAKRPRPRPGPDAGQRRRRRRHRRERRELHRQGGGPL